VPTRTARDPSAPRSRRRSRSLRRVARAGLALGVGLAAVGRPGPSLAHEVGDHGNLHIGGGTCLEARNHFEESHHRTTGYGAHLYAKSESTAALSIFGRDLCPGIALGFPRGHLYARDQFLLWRDNQWWQCLNVAEFSTHSGQWSLTVGTDTGDKAPCVSPSDRRGYWFLNLTSHYYLKGGTWEGSWLQSAPHVVHNK